MAGTSCASCLVVALSVLVGFSRGNQIERGYGRGSWWMDLPYEDDSYNVRQEFLKNATLACFSEQGPSSYEIEYWVLPDTTVLKRGERREFYTLDGTSAWEVTSDGRHMHVTVIQERQFGFYYCHVRDGGNYHVIKKALNYKGAYFTDLWDKYKDNTMVALIASGAVLLLFVVCWVIYEFRYIPPEKRPKKETGSEAGHEGESESEAEYEGKDNTSQTSSKPPLTDMKGASAQWPPPGPFYNSQQPAPGYESPAYQNPAYESQEFPPGNAADHPKRDSVVVHAEALVTEDENVATYHYDGKDVTTVTSF